MFRYATLIIVTVFVLMGGSFYMTFAGTNELPKPGITPANRLYFLDEWTEKIVYWFTLGLENKTERLLKFADEKLAEAQKLIEKNKPFPAKKARDKYKEYLNKAQRLTEQARAEGKEKLADRLVELIAEKTVSHQGIFTKLSENIPKNFPDKVQETILNIIEISRKGFKQALETISTQQKRNQILKRFKDLKTEINEKLDIIRENLKEMGVPLR